LKHCVQNLWKEYLILNTVSVLVSSSSLIQFSEYDISIQTSGVINILWYRILGAQSGGDSYAWPTVMCV